MSSYEQSATPASRMGVLLVLLVVAVVARAPAAHAWDKDGHYMTCKVAEVSELRFSHELARVRFIIGRRHWKLKCGSENCMIQSFLTEEASTAVKSLLAGGGLAETCSWADEHRSEFPWSIELHFADSEAGCLFNYTSKLSTSL